MENNPGWHEEDSPWKAHHVLELLRKNHIEPEIIIDVGCGAGRLLATMQSEMPASTTLIGYDIAPAAIELARKHECENLKFVCNNVLEAKGTVCDTMLLMDVFEHVPDYLGFLESLRNISRYFVFHIPLDMNLVHLLTDRQVKSREVAGHLHYFSKATALRTLEDTGYEIVDWKYTRVFTTAKAHRSISKLILNLPRLGMMALSPDLCAKVLGGCSLLVLARTR